MVCCLNTRFTYIILIHSGRIFCVSVAKCHSMPKSSEKIRILICSKKICSVQRDFFEGQHVVFKEEHETTQLKCLKAYAPICVTLADRVANKSNKLALYSSAFANRRECHIYCGIDDHGIQVGEEISNKDETQIIDAPESYHIVESMVDKQILKMTKLFSLETASAMKDNQQLVTTNRVGKETPACLASRTNSSSPTASRVPNLFSRIRWSKKSNETRYMILTEYLRKLRQLSMWAGIGHLVRELNKHWYLRINDELLSICQLTSVALMQEHFIKAENYLKVFQTKVSSSGDPLIFQLEGCYLAAVIERSRGNYKQAWSIIEDGLSMVNQVPAGLVPAAFLLNAASILSSILNDEWFVADSKKKSEDGLTRKQRNIDRAKRYCHEALDHLTYVKDYETAKKDLNQRISITLCFLYLGSSISAGPYEDGENSISVSEDDLNCAEERCQAIYTGVTSYYTCFCL